jgi:putative ABC transport system permease protein
VSTSFDGGQSPVPGERIYRCFLLLHPRDFRQRYQEELVACLREAWHEQARGRGARAALAFWTRTLSGTAATAWHQRVRVGRGADDARTSEEGAMQAWSTWVENRMLDVRFALRMWRRSPGFAAAALLTLGISIGSATAVYTVVDAVLLDPLPYPASERLFRVAEDGDDGSFWLSAPNYFDLKHGLASFESMGAYTPDGANMMVEGEPARVSVAEADADFFATMGLTPVLGRTFTEAERTAAAPVAVVSHSLWQERMGGRPDAIGTTLVLDGRVREVIGVLPRGLTVPAGADVWTPLSFDTPEWRSRRGIDWIQVIGRLRPDADAATMRAEAAALSASLRKAFPEENRTLQVGFRSLEEATIGNVRQELRTLLAAVALVVLVAAINVGGLLLARAGSRRSEVAVRAALGGGRGRLASQLVTECALLAAAGGVLGLAVARIALSLLLAAAPPGTPRLDEVSLGGAAILFALGCALAAGVVFGVLPTLASLRDAQVMSESRSGSRAGARLRGGLVVAQVALALGLLFGAGLLGKSFWKLRRVDLGFDPEPVLVAGLPIGDTDFSSASEREAYYQAILDGAQALPGVRAAALTSSAPFTGLGVVFSYELPELPPDPRSEKLARFRIVTPGLFAALGIPVLRGRAFEAGESDADGLPGAVVSEDLARLHFPEGDPLGRRIATAGDTFRIVGVVPSVRDVAAHEPSAFPFLYVPVQPATRQSMALVVAAEGDPAALVDPVRRLVRELAPAQPVAPLEPLAGLISSSVAGPRFTLLLLLFFACGTLLLAAIGVYGQLAYSVGRRTREIGVRVALGAPVGRVRAMVLRQGMTLAVTGLLLGATFAFWAGSFLEGLLFQVDARDPGVFAAVALTLLATTVVASWIPARRATGIAPVDALKTE